MYRILCTEKLMTLIMNDKRIPVRKIAGTPGEELLKQSLPSLKVASEKADIRRVFA